MGGWDIEWYLELLNFRDIKSKTVSKRPKWDFSVDIWKNHETEMITMMMMMIDDDDEWPSFIVIAVELQMFFLLCL